MKKINGTVTISLNDFIELRAKSDMLDFQQKRALSYWEVYEHPAEHEGDTADVGYRCAQCGYEYHIELKEHSEPYRYCPECGRHMIDVDEWYKRNEQVSQH